MRIKADQTVAIALDIQSKLMPFITGNLELELRTYKLIQGLKTLEIPMIVTEQYPKGIGHTVESVKESLGDEYKPIEKLTFSCCGSSEFMLKINEIGRKYVIIFGIESHVCVLQTCIDLIHEGFTPVIIEDCVSSRSLNDKSIAIERMRQEGAIISTYESILFELLVISGTEEFKAISKLIK